MALLPIYPTRLNRMDKSPKLYDIHDISPNFHVGQKAVLDKRICSKIKSNTLITTAIAKATDGLGMATATAKMGTTATAKITGILWGAAAKATGTPEAALFGVCSRSIEQCLEDASGARLWRKSASTAIAKMGTVDTAQFTGIFGELLRKRRGLRGPLCRRSIEQISKMLTLRGSGETHLLLLSLK